MHKRFVFLYSLSFCLWSQASNTFSPVNTFTTEKGCSSNIYATIREEVEERPTFSLKMRFLNSVLVDFVKANISVSSDIERYIIKYIKTLDANRNQAMYIRSAEVTTPTLAKVMQVVKKSILKNQELIEVINGTKDNRNDFVKILLGNSSLTYNNFTEIITHMTIYDHLRYKLNEKLHVLENIDTETSKLIEMELMNEEILHRVIDDELIMENLIHKGKNLSQKEAFYAISNISQKIKEEADWKPNIDILKRLDERIAVAKHLRRTLTKVAAEREKMIKDRANGLLGNWLHAEIPISILIRNELIREREIQSSINKALRMNDK